MPGCIVAQNSVGCRFFHWMPRSAQMLHFFGPTSMDRTFLCRSMYQFCTPNNYSYGIRRDLMIDDSFDSQLVRQSVQYTFFGRNHHVSLFI
jgi:hypothetical protein